MKNAKYLIVVLALGLLFVAYRWAYATSEESAPTASAAESAINAIMTRTSVRAYTDEDVSEEQLDTLLRAAMSAPTAVNKQPWRFVVIRERATLDYIAANFGSMKMMQQAPLAIVVCGDLDAALEGEAQAYWVQDASAATENLLVAANAMGLGTVWCGVFPKSDRVEAFSKLLGLPEQIIPLNCIAVGHPSGERSPKDKWHPDFVHYGSWAGTPAELPAE